MCVHFRFSFLGLVYGIYGLSCALWGVLYHKIVKRQKKVALRNQAKENAMEVNGITSGHANVTILNNKEDMERDSTI